MFTARFKWVALWWAAAGILSGCAGGPLNHDLTRTSYDESAAKQMTLALNSWLGVAQRWRPQAHTVETFSQQEVAQGRRQYEQQCLEQGSLTRTLTLSSARTDGYGVAIPGAGSEVRIEADQCRWAQGWYQRGEMRVEVISGMSDPESGAPLMPPSGGSEHRYHYSGFQKQSPPHQPAICVEGSLHVKSQSRQSVSWETPAATHFCLPGAPDITLYQTKISTDGASVVGSGRLAAPEMDRVVDFEFLEMRSTRAGAMGEGVVRLTGRADVSIDVYISAGRAINTEWVSQDGENEKQGNNRAGSAPQ